MKIKEILEGDVIMGDFSKKEPDYNDEKYDSEIGQDMVKNMDNYGNDKNSVDKLSNEIDKRRYQKMLSVTDGTHIEGFELIPYLRKFIKGSNRKEFSNLVQIMLTGKPHVYDLVMHINDLLRKSNTNNQVIGVSQNEDDWYFSKG